MLKRVLTVAESDTSGSTGIQADIKTVLALGGYATTAVSGVVARSTQGVFKSCPMEPAFVAEQMRTVLGDIGTDAIKIGYLSSEEMINAVGDVLDAYEESRFPVIVDPSIIARDHALLADEPCVAALKRRLFLRATVLTPNLREAEILTGMTIKDLDDMRHATDMMRTLGVETVVLKAGQALSEKVLYFIAGDEDELVYERPMLSTEHTLGAGCTLSSAIAISLAQGLKVDDAVARALDFMHQAILNAPSFGDGAGPMNHAFDIGGKAADFHSGNIKVHQA